MKSFLLILFVVICYTSLFSQLTIFGGEAQSGPSATCGAGTIYTGAAIPGSLNDGVSSLQLQQGYMATLAENEDGSGAAYTFIAAISNISVNLNKFLDNKVSFIRVLPFRNTLKKGVGLQSNAFIDQVNVSWFYDWGANDVSLSSREYTMMSWGKQGATNPANIATYINKPDVTHLLSFNEPDNTDQSNIPFADAVSAHKNLAATGLRLGSPAPTESAAFTWLTSFMAGTRQENIKVDFMAVHWYDWGSYTSTGNTAPDPNGVFTRFKNYITNIYAIYGKPIWITEFNANRNTTSATHEAFIALALPWLEAQPFVERYAYFFPPALPPVDGGGTITPIGIAYRDFAASTLAVAKNYDNTELLADDLNVLFEGENAALYNPGVANITPNCATASGGRMATAVTGSNRIGFHEIHVPASGNYKMELSYFAKTNTGRNLTIRINHGTPQVVAIPGSGNWCFEGGSPALFEFPVSLLAGNNSIEFTESPIIDFIKIKEDATLPVSLMDLTGIVRHKSIELNWRTAQEQNSQYFDILKSSDGNQFISIGKVNAAGNSNAINSYLFIDNRPVVGTNFYKLKMLDADGKFTYSNTIAVKFGTVSDGLTLVASTPNSVRVSIYCNSNEKAYLMYMAMDGKVLHRQSVVLYEGINFVEIPTSAYKGLGVITLQQGKTMSNLKIIR